MKKVTIVTVVVISISVGGVRISHAHSKNKAKQIRIIHNILSSDLDDISNIKNIDKIKTIDSTFDSNRFSEKIKSKTLYSNEEKNHENTLESLYFEDKIDETFYSDSSSNNHTIESDESTGNFNQEAFYENNNEHIKDTHTVHTGVSYLGYDYDLGNFSGIGYVPSWTNTVFQWDDFPKHYLIEKNSYPGQTIFGLTIGSEVIISGVTFNVYDIVYNIENDFEALNLVLFNEAAATMQVCVTDDEDAALNLYFLR